MTKKSSRQIKNHDQKIIEPNAYLQTEKSHKDWYASHGMGKQAGRPRLVPKDVKKKAGIKKQSLRKEI